MGVLDRMLSLIAALWHIVWDVFLFWIVKIFRHFNTQSTVETWSHRLRDATDYEAWYEAAVHLDLIFGLDLWRTNPASKHYDFRLINERLRLMEDARQSGDVYALTNALRTGLVRNLGNITSPKLFNCSFSGTKFLIDQYVNQYVDAIEEVAALPPPPTDGDQPTGRSVSAMVMAGYEDGEVSADSGGSDTAVESGTAVGGIGGSGGTSEAEAFLLLQPRRRHRDRDRAQQQQQPESGMASATMSTQQKLDFMHDTRQAFGRTALVLQGGAIFGLCHLGVVKALLHHKLLPRIIVGTATGAMMAALVGVHAEKDLVRILSGEDGIDVSAFAARGHDPDRHNERVHQSVWTWWATLLRRIRRFEKEGYFLDVKVLEECVRANIGDLTFEEAYNRSKRVLNITVVTAGQEGIPTLLNYVTAPNVLVWTAAVASNASSSTFYGHRQTKILCKDAHGTIRPWAPTETVHFGHWTSASYTGRHAPLQRVAALFNVNHYIVSQARPYLIPFLQSDMHGPTAMGKRNTLNAAKAFCTRMVGLEVRHRLRQLDRLRLLPPSIRRFLVDEHLPGPSMTLVPQVGAGDFVRLVETPTRETVAYWILRGERSVWPAVAALRVRCAIEMELDRAYQDVRRLKATDMRRRASEMSAAGAAARERLSREGEGVRRCTPAPAPAPVGAGARARERSGGEGARHETHGVTSSVAARPEEGGGGGGEGANRRRAQSISATCPPAAHTPL